MIWTISTTPNPWGLPSSLNNEGNYHMRINMHIFTTKAINSFFFFLKVENFINHWKYNDQKGQGNGKNNSAKSKSQTTIGKKPTTAPQGPKPTPKEPKPKTKGLKPRKGKIKAQRCHSRHMENHRRRSHCRNPPKTTTNGREGAPNSRNKNTLHRPKGEPPPPQSLPQPTHNGHQRLSKSINNTASNNLHAMEQPKCPRTPRYAIRPKREPTQAPHKNDPPPQGRQTHHRETTCR